MSDLSEFYDEDSLPRNDDGELDFGDECFPCEDDETIEALEEPEAV